jgi:hypothetical protein
VLVFNFCWFNVYPEMAAGYGSDISEQDKYEEEMGPFFRDIASSGNSLI